jgi:hypothetical protein
MKRRAMTAWGFFLTVSLFALVVYVYMPRSLSGQEFIVSFEEGSDSPLVTWYLYKISSNEYCFRRTGYPIARRICVDKNQIDVTNSPDGRAEQGFVRQGEVALKSG